MIDLAAAHGLDDEQTTAAAEVASADPLVIVEGAAGSGKTTMLSTAIEGAEREGRAVRVVAPTKKAAEVAHIELGVPADSVAALVYAYGWRWNNDGVWTRLAPGDTDPDTGHRYEGPPADARLTRGDRVVVDEAGMIDQDTAHKDEADNANAVLRAVEEHAATVRAEVVEPLTVQAQADGSDYLNAVADEAEATERLHRAGRFGRRRAEHDHHTAHEYTEALRGRLRTEWGTVPANDDALSQWAALAASARAEHTPQVTEATATVTDAHDAQQAVTERQQRDRRALLAKLHGPENVRRDPVRYQVTTPSREARRWQAAADKARAEAERLRALPPAEAARQLATRQAAAEATRQATTPEPPQRRPAQPTAPGRGLGR